MKCRRKPPGSPARRFPKATPICHLGVIYRDGDFAQLFPFTGQDVLVAAQAEYGIQIVGPVAADPSWQVRLSPAFAKAQFQVDWECQVVTCTAGQESLSWLPNTYPRNGVVWEARFAKATCTPCVHRAQCTHAKVEPRLIALQHRAQEEALQQRRAEQGTPEFRAAYAARAGIEGTHSQSIRRCDLRQARYFGLVKTHLQQILTARRGLPV